MKKILVCGAGGFIGNRLVKKLRKEGHWVRGVDIKYPEFNESYADDFKILDLTKKNNATKSLSPQWDWFVDVKFDEVYQLAANMGGMGFIHSAECEIITDNTLINLNMINEASKAGIKKFLFASSACVYRNQQIGEKRLSEEEAYPALPDNEYGWEKLYAERMISTFERNTGIEARIARFQNCFGPSGTWQGGREKAPAAICRKVAKAKDGESIDVWGDGTAIRNYTYIDDMCDGLCALAQSNINEPVNIGTDDLISVEDLTKLIIKISGKNININYIDGPVGVQGRYEKFDKIKSLGWKPQVSLEEGLTNTYKWIEDQVASK
jgi:nucleoside-diphosphate-sugar epimerase